MKLIDLENINFPTKKDEDFRKINLSSILSKEFEDSCEYKLDIKDLKISKEPINSSNELTKINNSLKAQTYELNINEDTKKPIIIVHKLNDANKAFVNSLKINVKKEVKVSVIEVFVNDKEEIFYSVNREFNIENNAHLEYLKIQDMSENSTLFTNYINNIKNTASLNHTNFEAGIGFNLNIYETALKDENSSVNINGYVNLIKSANSSSIFYTNHDEQNNESHIKYKHILNDSSKASFQALSKVDEKAYFSKVHQNTDTIILSDEATIFAKPHLQINIDELEASHGATTGSLNKEQLLYLKSRGISETKAKQMLLKAIKNDVLESIQDEQLKQFAKDFKRQDYV